MNFIKQNPWQASSPLASQEIPRLLMEYVYKSSSVDPNLGQLNPYPHTLYLQEALI
jgi:hypothetical protein